MAVLRGDGTGGFGSPVFNPVHTDLVGPSPTGGATRMWFGDGTGRFSDSHGLGRGNALLHDLDGDSRLDVVLAAADTVKVHVNRLNGRPTH